MSSAILDLLTQLQTNTILDISNKYLRGLDDCLFVDDDITTNEMKKLYRIFNY
jgi:hypothetical protein